jgi:hypothetical protein
MSRPADGKPRRPNLGHTKGVLIKLHPDLFEYLVAEAEAGYVSVPEYVRQLIIADKRIKEAGR